MGFGRRSQRWLRFSFGTRCCVFPLHTKVQMSADMFEIVNKAILVHPLFQGYVDSYSRLLKEAGPF